MDILRKYVLDWQQVTCYMCFTLLKKIGGTFKYLETSFTNSKRTSSNKQIDKFQMSIIKHTTLVWTPKQRLQQINQIYIDEHTTLFFIWIFSLLDPKEKLLLII
jgi:hypothetical protein